MTFSSHFYLRYYHLGVDEPEPYELENEKKAALLRSPDTSTEEIVAISPLEEKSVTENVETSTPSKECPPLKKATSTSKSSRTRSNKSQHKTPRLPKLTQQSSLPSCSNGGAISKRQNSLGETRKTTTRSMSLLHKASHTQTTDASTSTIPWPTKLFNKVFRRRKAMLDSARCPLPPIVCHNSSAVLSPVVEECSDPSANAGLDTSQPTLLLLSRSSSLMVEISQSMEKICADGLSLIQASFAKL